MGARLALHFSSLSLTDLTAQQLGDEDSDEEDPFASVEGDETLDHIETDLETNVARDKFARLCSGVEDLIERIGGEDEYEVREASLELVSPRLAVEGVETNQ